MEYVTLIDDTGNTTGKMEKIEAHRNGGSLHSAFSIFIFNNNKELLLQKRADNKYHFSNLWTNTCCGHPRPDEKIILAANRRLEEEFGFSSTLNHELTFNYQAHDEQSKLTEKERVSVFSGNYNKTPYPSPMEISDWCWQPIHILHESVENSPQNYTPWFHIILEKIDLLSVATSASLKG